MPRIFLLEEEYDIGVYTANHLSRDHTLLVSDSPQDLALLPGHFDLAIIGYSTVCHHGNLISATRQRCPGLPIILTVDNDDLASPDYSAKIASTFAGLPVVAKSFDLAGLLAQIQESLESSRPLS